MVGHSHEGYTNDARLYAGKAIQRKRGELACLSIMHVSHLSKVPHDYPPEEILRNVA